jgi:hypothetical protein
MSECQRRQNPEVTSSDYCSGGGLQGLCAPVKDDINESVSRAYELSYFNVFLEVRVLVCPHAHSA